MQDNPVLYPDPRLKRPTAPVTVFDATLETEVARLVAGLRDIPAIGLAGPHLGIMRRVVVIDLANAGGPAGAQIFVNPQVTWASAETASFEEGSVSLPGVLEHVTRPASIRLSWSTRAGEDREGAFEGFMAACLQHEVDQCDGIFWLDRLSRLKRDRALARYDKLTRSNRRAAASAAQ